VRPLGGNRMRRSERQTGMGHTKHDAALRAAAAATGLLLLLTACGSDSGSGESDPTTPETTPQTPVVEPVDRVEPDPARLEGDDAEPSQPIVGEAPDALIEDILADVRERTGVDLSDLSVTRAESVVWNDGSLGCPEPGVLYTQAQVDGYHVVIGMPDGEMDYRTSGVDWFVVCENGAGFPIDR